VAASLVRVAVGVAAGALTILVGLVVAGALDPSPSPEGIAAGANLFTAIGAVGLIVGVAAYAAVEWLQTRRLDSIARQFSTRAIVLMALAIPINIVLGQVVGSALRLPLYLDSIGTILVGVLAGPIAGAATGLLSNLTWTFVLGGTPLGSPFAWPFGIVAAEIGFVAGVVAWAGGFRRRPDTPAPRLLAALAAGGAVLVALVAVGILPFYRNLCGETGATPGPLGTCLDLLQPGAAADPVARWVGLGLLGGLVLGLVGVAVRLAGRRDAGVVVALVAGAICGVISALIAAPIAAVVFGGVTGGGTDLLVAMFQQLGSDLQTAVLQQALISDSIDKSISYVLVFTVVAALSRRLAARFPQGDRVLARPGAAGVDVDAEPRR
jgi:energy-coupling factor transport system substrate-specific component